MPTTVFPNFPPGGHIDDENNQKAIEALKNAKEYTIVNEEEVLHQESILSELVFSFSGYNQNFIRFSLNQFGRLTFDKWFKIHLKKVTNYLSDSTIKLVNLNQ